MRIRWLLPLLIATPVHAQTGVQPPQGWSLGLFAGGAAFTDFQRQTMRATGFSSSGQIEQREIPQRLGAVTSGTLAGALAFWPSRNWGLRLRGTYTPSRFETIIGEADARFLKEPRSSDETGSLASLNIFSYDVQAVFRMPTIRNRIMPYGVVGVGLIEYDLKSRDKPIPADVRGNFENGRERRRAPVIGLGAMLPLRPKGWSTHFELTDQLAKTPVESKDRDAVKLTSHVSFVLGLSWTRRK